MSIKEARQRLFSMWLYMDKGYRQALEAGCKQDEELEDDLKALDIAIEILKGLELDENGRLQ